MSRSAENVQLLPSTGQSARRWPFFVCLITVILLGGSPWLYSRVVPQLYDFQNAGNSPYTTPEEMIYNPFDMDNFTYDRAREIFRCTNKGKVRLPPAPPASNETVAKQCPSYFRFIRDDLSPWNTTGITQDMIESAKIQAGFRIVILSGKLYVERYYRCYQSRGVYTLWGLLLMMEKYKGQVPDVEFVFNCEDRPRIPKVENSATGPPVLLAYDSNSENFDIPFPDWSFWGWSDLLISSWEDKRETIANGSQRIEWKDKLLGAYWSGNIYSGAPHRVELLKCHHARLTEIRGQNWGEEVRTGKQNSKLEDQCNHRYMIYTEGNGWSVSLKYIMACGSPTLLLAPAMYDFFSRGMRQWEHYIPIRPTVLAAPEICDALDRGVEFGEANQTEAVRIGKAGLEFMRNEVGMENVYNYMFHALREYSQLLKFQPVQGDAHLVTLDHVLCLQENEADLRILQQAIKEMPMDSVPCKIPEIPDSGLVEPDWETHWPVL